VSSNLRKMLDFKDQLGNSIILKERPKRVISIVPSQTELLSYLGLDDNLVGITKFCIHPQELYKSKQKVGGTKKINFDIIDQLKPDLIIGNKEENEKSDIELLMKKYPVWMSDIYTIEDNYHMILSIGEIFNVVDRSKTLVDEIKSSFKELECHLPDVKNKKVAYLIWKEPLMAAGFGTFINEMIKLAGFENIFTNLKRYPIINTIDLQLNCPDFIFLSSEPYPFTEKHIQYFNEHCPNSKTILVDGELFTWYGNRVLYSAEYFKNLHHQLNNGI
jgi:ABC-type Fe3+-hydroxamate transport system substrate-binding protein